MNRPTSNIDELQALTDMACNNALTDDDSARLEELLYDNAESQHFYLTRLSFDAWLQWEFTEQTEETPPPPSGHLPSVLFATPNKTISYLPDNMPLGYFVATLVMGLGMLVAAFTYVSPPEQNVVQSSQNAEERLTSNSQESRIVGQVTGMVDCKWKNAETVFANKTHVVLGQKYAITSGLMEITYDTGAKVILQGPAIYEVVVKNGGVLSLGKLIGKVETKTAAGFSVRTPNAVITDLGTEFGVEVTRSGKTVSHVFRGSVKVSVIGNKETPDVLLAANDSLHVEKIAGPSNPEEIRVRRVPHDATMATTFVRTLASVQSANESEAYGRMVLSMQPAVYYRMEAPKERKDLFVLHDSAPGGHHGRIHFPKGYLDNTPYVAGRFGSALRFRGLAIQDYAIVPDYPKTTNDCLTVSVWVLASRRCDFPVIAGNRAGPFTPGGIGVSEGQFLLYMSPPDNAVPTGFGTLWAGVSQRNRENAAIHEQKESNEKLFSLGMWQHVVLVVDATEMRLYHNGCEVAHGSCGGIISQPPRHLTIGCKAPPEDNTGPQGYWQGLIDELAVFNRALSDQEVQLLFVGRPDAVVEPLKTR